MKITRLDKIEKERVEMEGAKDVWKQVPISKDDGSPIFSLRVFSVEENGYTPYHVHPFEHVNYVIQGHGALVSEDGEEHELRKGDFALVMPDEKHQYRNKSESEVFIMICGVPKDYE